MKYMATITSVSVHPEGDNPVFAETATTIRLQDEGGGYFIELGQGEGSIRLDAEEIDLVMNEAKKLLKNAKGDL
jgi:hypothetical protein